MDVVEIDEPHTGAYYADGDDVIEYVNVAKVKQVTENDFETVENEVPKNVEAIGLLRYFVAFDRIRKYVINGGGRFFLFAYVLVNMVWTVQAAPDPQCAMERTGENENEFPFLIMVMTILAIAFLFGLCLGSRCGRALQARAEVMEPEMETEPGTSRETGVQHEDCSEHAEMTHLRYLVRRHEHSIAMLKASEKLWKDEVERYRQIRNEAMRILERVRIETLNHANVCPMNDHPILVASR